MPTTEDLRFVSRIGEVASAGDADDFGSSEYHRSRFAVPFVVARWG